MTNIGPAPGNEGRGDAKLIDSSIHPGGRRGAGPRHRGTGGRGRSGVRGGRRGERGERDASMRNTNSNSNSNASTEVDSSTYGDGSGQRQKRSRHRNNRGAKMKSKHQKEKEDEIVLVDESIVSEVVPTEGGVQIEETEEVDVVEPATDVDVLVLAASEYEALTSKMKEANEVLKYVVEMTIRHKTLRQAMMEDRVLSSRKDFEANKKKLKTDLKKCTAFVKKVKSGSAWLMKNDDLIHEISTLNMSRYVEEVVAAILESKPKVVDIPIVTVLCSEMHIRYEDFLPNLQSTLWDVVHSTPEGDGIKARRFCLRLLTEFLLCGLLTETKQLMKLVVESTGGKSSTYSVQDPNLIVAFSKAAGFEILAIVPRTVREALRFIHEHDKENTCAGTMAIQNESASKYVIVLQEGLNLAEQCVCLLSERAVDADSSTAFANRCVGAFHFLANSLVQTNSKLLNLEKRCEQDRLLAGSLTEVREKGLLDARRLKENLQKSVEIMSDVLDRPMPYLEVDNEDGTNELSLGVEVWTKRTSEGGDDFGPFDDEETRSFYCDIPDLLTTVPPALLGMTFEQIERRKDENAKKYGNVAEAEIDEGDTSLEVISTSEAEFDAVENVTDDFSIQDDCKENDDSANKDTPHYKLMVMMDNELPECHSREQIDEIAEKFCTNNGSSKSSRKRLLRTLFLVPRNRPDLLPLYSRLLATVDRVWGDIAPSLVTELEQQFHGQARFKKNQNIESRMRTARYIGELTKFRVAPPIIFLRCFRRCLDDFTGSNVEILCCLLETSGRFLFRLKHTNSKLVTLMETATRLSRAKNLDERLHSLLKSAFHNVDPPPSGPRKQAKLYPPLESYLRHLLIVRLDPTDATVTFVSKQIGRLPWNDPAEQIGALVAKIMLKACRRGRYKTIRAIAATAEKLRTQRSAAEVTVRLIDSVLEELRWALERPLFRDQQRILTYARLLGELHETNQVSGQLVIRQLYDFINIGHEIPQALREASKHLVVSDTATVGGMQSSLPLFNYASHVSQTIIENEELEDSISEPLAETISVGPASPVAVSDHSKWDPRVLTMNDPPNSAYRIKLVCTLFEAAAQSLVTRSNLPRLKAFLVAFQRYLFTKSVLPTEVEFTLLDTFDVIDSRWRLVSKSQRSNDAESKDHGFPRYTSWLEAHNDTVAFEETEAIFQSHRVDCFRVSNGESLNDEFEELSLHSDDEDDEDDESTTATGKNSVITDDVEEEVDTEVEIGAEVDDEDHLLRSEADDERSGISIENVDEVNFDEELYMRQLEEEAFERELRVITMTALEKGKSTARKQVADCMPSGSQIIRKKDTAGINETTLYALPSTALSGKEGICFQLLKKGVKGKVEAKDFVVPKDTNLAIVATRHDDEAARERDVIKQRVLQYEADSSNAEFSGGNVYLEQEKLQVIRNRPLLMDDIDRNFGTSGGNLRQTQNDKVSLPTMAATPSSAIGRRGSYGRGEVRGNGRGGGRLSSSGRTLFR